MKKVVLIFLSILFVVISAEAHDPISSGYNPNFCALSAQGESGMMEESSRYYDRKIRNRDYALALVPGAVQMRRKWPAVAGSIWGGIAVTGGLAIGEQINISRLEKDMANNPYATDWHLNQIRRAKRIRNGSLIALGGVYIANYVTALLLPDRNPNTSWIALHADPQGAVGLTYTLNF